MKHRILYLIFLPLAILGSAWYRFVDPTGSEGEGR